jgi:adenine C2-methylase RlmN of 23S rRNA A2503 and tRNA A37
MSEREKMPEGFSQKSIRIMLDEVLGGKEREADSPYPVISAEKLQPQASEFREALKPCKIFFQPGCSPEFIERTLDAYNNFHNVQAIKVEQAEEGEVDIIISELGENPVEELDTLIQKYRGKKAGFKSLTPIVTVSGPGLNLSKKVLARLAVYNIRHLEDPSSQQLACTIGSLETFQTNLNEKTVQPLAKRTDEKGNGKNIFLTRDGQTVEDGSYLLSGENCFYPFMTGGPFGNGIQIEKKLSICKSCQKGCVLSETDKACAFCFTGKVKFKGNLTAQEMVDGVELALLDHPQGMIISDKTEKNPKTILQVSFMGEGEPLYNLDEVLKAIRFLNEKYYWVTFSFSTIGIKKGIEQLLNEDLRDISLQPQLSVHFADERRAKLMKEATGENSIEQTLPLMFKLAQKLNHKLTLNMIMLGGPEKWRNNRAQDAHNFVTLVKSLCGKDAFKHIRVKISEFNGGPGNFKAGGSKEFIDALTSDVGPDLQCQEIASLGTKKHAGCGSLIGADISQELVQIDERNI